MMFDLPKNYENPQKAGCQREPCPASDYDQVTRTMIVGHLCHAADQTQHSRLMQVANAIMDTMSRRKKPQRRQWSRDTGHLDEIIAELRALPEDEPNEIIPKTAQDAERQPCPFCGDITTGFTRNQGFQVLHCLNCGAMGPMMQEKAEDWNKHNCRS